jgi:hypothetical protein
MTVDATMTNYTCFGSSSCLGTPLCGLAVNVTMTNYTCLEILAGLGKPIVSQTPATNRCLSLRHVFWFGFVMVVVPNIYLMIIKIPATSRNGSR